MDFVHPGFIATFFKLASDDDPSVRRHVCQALVLLLAARPEKLMPEMGNVAEYMLYSTKDKNENFWLTFTEDADLAMYLHPLLGKVASVLLDYMIYGEVDLLWLEGDAEDAAVPDKYTDIKPRHYSGGKLHGLEHNPNGNPAPQKTRVGAYSKETIDSDEEDDYVRFGGDLLNVLLGPLKEKLWSQNWLQRESDILALRTMAEGCIEAIEPHLTTHVPYLINTLSDPKPLVRSITCSTLGCYASWTMQPISEEHKNLYFVPTMEGLLRMVLDNNKRVQEAGCSAFAMLEEDIGLELAPYPEPVLQNLVIAFDKYQHKNMLVLYDAFGTLADTVSRTLQNPRYVEILMPPLMNRWFQLKGDDEDLIPLLERRVRAICAARFRSVHQYHPPVTPKVPSLPQNPDMEEPDKSFLIVVLDLLSGLTQGLGMELQPLINAPNPNLLQLLTAPVCQSAYALVGDMVMGCFVLLRPHMPVIMAELILQLEPEPKYHFISASNNAAWSVGEVALRYGRDDPKFKQWVQPLIEQLIPILLHPKAPRSLHENAAVSIGHIGLTHPDIVAPHLPEFAQSWCQALYDIRDNEEKDSVFRGSCTLVQVNPPGISKVHCTPVAPLCMNENC
ncbi:armadillo-type protein [Mycena sanguinolenta]|nr:armadillo-type protein [Mycena sanguinolenta]